MHERRFVLEPLTEIAPEAGIRCLKRTVRELRDALPAGQSGSGKPVLGRPDREIVRIFGCQMQSRPKSPESRILLTTETTED